MPTEIQKNHKGEITLDDVRDRIITIQNESVLLDSDAAWLYGVETSKVNQAVKRNRNKFPEGYIIALTDSEKKEVVTICDNPKTKFSPTLPKAFTEKGLYMLATILKSERATATTLPSSRRSLKCASCPVWLPSL